MSEVELYIARFSPEVQRRLVEMRNIGFDVFPNVRERIYYGNPTFTIDGKDILWYAAYKNHISLVIGPAMSDFLRGIYPQYSYTEHTIRFPHEENFPGELIREICELLEHNRNKNEP